jgi:hypothetical protein
MSEWEQEGQEGGEEGGDGSEGKIDGDESGSAGRTEWPETNDEPAQGEHGQESV